MPKMKFVTETYPDLSSEVITATNITLHQSGEGTLQSIFFKTKYETTSCFKNYMNLVNRRFPKTDGPKIYRSDNGGEPLVIGFRDACAAEGLATEMSESEAHHQNGVIERTHRTLADTVQSLMLQAKLPHYLWEYAVRSAVHTRNRVISRSDPTMTPFEKFWGRKPDLKFVKTFGQRCVAMIPPRERTAKYKFRSKGQRGVFIGSDPQRKGFFVYVSGRRHAVVHSRSVIVLEPPTSHSVQTISDPQDDPLRIVGETDAAGDDDNSFDSDTMTTNSKRHSSSSTRIAEYTGKPAPPNLRRSERIANLSTSVALSAAHVQLQEIIQEPLNLKAARASTEWHLWEKALRDEIKALRANDTFDLVDPPPGAHSIGSTIVFRVKLRAHGEVERLKARTCAQGFTEEFLKDYYETYAPVAKLTSIRVFLAMATQMGARVRQGDVPTAYVKTGLTEVLYIRQPRGFEEGSRTKVWRLKKALYGLKQAGREWNVALNKFLVGYGLIPTREDACVYIHPTNNLIVLVYVDDILIGYKSDTSMMNLMQALQTKYGMKDLGNVQWFLGIRITMDTTRGITTMDQTQHASEVLRRFEMDECRPRKTPLDKGTILYNRAETDDIADKVTNRQSVCSGLT
ncbi:unnamed protein product [Phytophthora fragariaefolia]|uniref:Unnamed protein product n=1 Tax=Phytophthora fragariaefolia TaxID=1490495 RepID=A0A9W6YRI4_9STRA|nr:unnamed protein product [Phytophthora fragariaefolia]